MQVESKHIQTQKKLKNYDKTFLGRPRSNAEECFGVIFDAGSSSTKLQVYKWLCRDLLELHLIHPVTALTDKASLGISSFNTDLQGLNGYLNNLLEKVKSVVPQEKWASTPIMLAATAGMRLLSQADKNAILQQTGQFLTSSGFLYAGQKRNRIITGQEEGVLFWIATNFLQQNIKDNKSVNIGNVKTSATIDLGGASTQIAFKSVQPQNNHQHDFSVTLPENNDHTIYSISYLGYGNDQARNFVVKLSKNQTASSIFTGCFNKGYSEPQDGKVINGTSDPEQCLQGIREFLDARNCPYPSEKEYSIQKSYQALIPQDMEIIAVSGVTSAIQEFKIQNLETVLRQEPQNNYIKTKCFLGLYASALLIDGFKVGDRLISSPSKINGAGPAWSLGFMLDEVSDLKCNVSEQGSCDLRNTFQNLKKLVATL